MYRYISLYLSRCVVICLGIACGPAYALNEGIIWSMNAMSCVPTPATLEAGLIDGQAGRVIFKSNRTGIASIICPIGSVSDEMRTRGLRSLFLTYRDGDRSALNNVVASIRRVNRASGHVETMSNGSVSSGGPGAPSSGQTGWATHQSATAGNTIGNHFDFSKFYYYVHISMKRDDAGVPLAVLGVFLQF